MNVSISSSNLEYCKQNTTSDMESINVYGRKFGTFNTNNYPKQLEDNLTRDEYKDVLQAFNKKLRLPLISIGVGGFFLTFLASGLITALYGKKIYIIIPIFVFGSLLFIISTYFSYKIHKQLAQLAELYTNFFVLKGVCFIYEFHLETQQPHLTIKYQSSANKDQSPSHINVNNDNNQSYSISISSSAFREPLEISNSLNGGASGDLSNSYSSEPTTGYFKIYA